MRNPKTSLGIAALIVWMLASCQRTESAPALAIQPPTKTASPSPILPTSTSTVAPHPTSPPIKPSATSTPTVLPVTELLFTGAIVPGRCVQQAIDERGDANYLYESMQNMIAAADIAVGTLNAALSDYAPRTGCIQTFVLVGGSENADAMAAAGFDVMSVATNHIKNCGTTDCGDRAFFDTLANLQRVGIEPVGAGENLNAALQPVIRTVNGVRFGFVSLGEIEANAFAGKSTPGIAVLTEENLRAAIAAARQSADVVIALPHWGPDYNAMPNYRQFYFAEIAVEAGADLVMGNHAHVIQGMELLEGVPVFYGLGSFIFDQSWSLETQQGVVVKVRFEGDEYLSHQVIPVHIEADGYVHLPEAEEAASVLKRFQTLSTEISEGR